MGSGSRIKSVLARQVFARQEFSGLGHPAVETTVKTNDGAIGVSNATGGFSVGKHEVVYLYDNGPIWGGFGVLKAVSNVNSIICPAINGMDATKQWEVDEVLNKLDSTRDKSILGGNAITSASTAVLKAGAASLGIPLYQHIGGVNACTLPVPGIICIDGSKRYGGGERGGGKPSYSFISYGFNDFSEASYACWEVREELVRIIGKKFDLGSQVSITVRLSPGQIEHDRELWDFMAEAIENLGYKNRVGIQVDVAAATYYDKDKDIFSGLFSKEDKTREDLIELYKDMVESFPFIILEDPLDEDDFNGHAILTKELGIEIVGDDLFVTNTERLAHGIEVGACNAVLLKIPQIGTFSEGLDVVQLAYRNGYAIMPCGSRGEGYDIADYAVGLNAGQIREGGIGPTANRLTAIEDELGSKAKFLGKAALKIG